jgi:hypothetical protein
MDHPTIWHHDDNMSINLSHPFKVDLQQYSCDDFWSYFENPFGHLDSLCDDPPSCSNLDNDKRISNPERS